MEWTNEKAVQLIAEYKKHPILWSSKHPQHFSRKLKLDAWERIAYNLKIEKFEAKQKMSSLLGSFRREKAKGTKTIDTAKGRLKIYVSKWFGFSKMQFLLDKNEPRETIDTENYLHRAFIVFKAIRLYSKMNIEYIESNGGGRNLLYSGHRYYLKRQNKNSSISWMCVNRKQCSGAVTISNQGEILRTTTHKCIPNVAKNEVSLCLDKARKRAREETTAISKIFNEEIGPLLDAGLELVTEVPNFRNKKNTLYKARRKELGVVTFNSRKKEVFPGEPNSSSQNENLYQSCNDDTSDSNRNSDEEVNEDVNNSSSNFVEVDERIIHSQDEAFVNPVPPKTKRIKTESRTEDTRLDEAYNILETPTPIQDEFSIYGQHIANKIRHYSKKTRAEVEHAISNILYAADIGKYECRDDSSSARQ